MASTDTTAAEQREATETLVAAVRDICADFPPAYWAECDAESRYPTEFVDAMAEGGWLGMNVPEEDGGGGLDHVTIAALLREIARSGAGLNGCVPVHMSMFAIEPLLRFGSPELKEEFLKPIVSGEKKLCFGVTEPGSGSDTSKIATRATAVDGGWRVSGQKIWITVSQVADLGIMLVRTADAPEGDRFGGLSLFLMDMKDERISIQPIPKMVHNAAVSCEIFFNDVFVPQGRLIGEEGKGFRHLLAALNSERVLMAAEMVGIGEVAIDTAVEYAKTREVFGSPIGANQAISHPLAQAHTRLAAAWLSVVDAAEKLDAGVPCGAEANGAKLLAADFAWEAADAALQTLGGMGVAKEYHVERYFREARHCRIAPISQEMTLNYLAQTVLGLPRSY